MRHIDMAQEGHALGNRVPIEVVRRLQASVRKNETLARIDGAQNLRTSMSYLCNA